MALNSAGGTVCESARKVRAASERTCIGKAADVRSPDSWPLAWIWVLSQSRPRWVGASSAAWAAPDIRLSAPIRLSHHQRQNQAFPPSARIPVSRFVSFCNEFLQGRDQYALPLKTLDGAGERHAGGSED